MAFSSGQTLTAAALNAALPLTARKTADETVTSSITPQNDDHLFVTVAASTTYLVYVWLFWTCTSNTPDFRNDFEGPTGATFVRSFFAQPNTATGVSGDIETNVLTTIGDDDGRGAINGNSSGLVVGTLTVSTTAGTFRMRWAQVTSDAAGVTLKAGSHMMLIPVS